MLKIGVIDLGLGNVKSVEKMFLKIGCEARLIQEPKNSQSVDVIVLPGVGSFTYGVTKLVESGWDVEIKKAAENGRRILGICLGMQLLCDQSEEGPGRGIGLIPGNFQRISCPETPVKVPQMGWNQLQVRMNAPSWVADPDPQARYYFVHSYRYFYETEAYVLADCDYGGKTTAIIRKDSVTGFQFHPEKSHRFGLSLLHRYLKASDDR